MKQIVLTAGLALVLAACNNSPKEAAGSGSEAAPSAATVELPFTLERPYQNWQIGSTQNVATSMASLKAFVDKDFAAMGVSFADSIEISLDGYQQKLSKDSAIHMLSNARGMYTDLVIKMNDYVAVISGDKKSEWVTIWYKQTWKDAKGVADSLAVINDFKIENGKIAIIDEKIQHFQAK